MASIGWKRQCETDTVSDFALIVKMFAEEKPNDAKLQAFSRKCSLTAIMLLQQERTDLEVRDGIKDRQSDCKSCMSLHNEARPCDAAKGRECIYKQPSERLRVIKHYFGDEGMHFIEWAGRIIKKREATACTR